MGDTKKATTPARTGPAAPADAQLLGGRPFLHDSIHEFLRANTNFESSQPIEAAMGDVASCKTLNEVFAVPLKHKLLTLERALAFALFLKLAPGRVNAELERPEPLFADAAAFSVDEAFSVIGRVYDLGVGDVVDAPINAALGIEDDEDDEDDDDEGEDNDDGAPET